MLVVDDGSPDRTGEIVSEYRAPVRYIRQQNAGSAAARNRGIIESRGRYVAFLDGDDVWHPEKLERQLEAMAEAPKAGVCHCTCQMVDEDLKLLRRLHLRSNGSLLRNLLIHGNVVGIPSVVIVRRELLDQVGYFDPTLSYCADWDLWIRLARHTEFCYLDEALVSWRQHGNNMTRQLPLLEHDSVKLLEKAFAESDTPIELRGCSSQSLSHNWMVLAGSYFRARKYRDFVRCMGHSLRLDPWQGSYLLGYPLRRLRRNKSGEPPVPMLA